MRKLYRSLSWLTFAIFFVGTVLFPALVRAQDAPPAVPTPIAQNVSQITVKLTNGDDAAHIVVLSAVPSQPDHPLILRGTDDRPVFQLGYSASSPVNGGFEGVEPGIGTHYDATNLPANTALVIVPSGYSQEVQEDALLKFSKQTSKSTLIVLSAAQVPDGFLNTTSANSYFEALDRFIKSNGRKTWAVPAVTQFNWVGNPMPKWYGMSAVVKGLAWTTENFIPEYPIMTVEGDKIVMYIFVIHCFPDANKISGFECNPGYNSLWSPYYGYLVSQFRLSGSPNAQLVENLAVEIAKSKSDIVLQQGTSGDNWVITAIRQWSDSSDKWIYGFFGIGKASGAVVFPEVPALFFVVPFPNSCKGYPSFRLPDENFDRTWSQCESEVQG